MSRIEDAAFQAEIENSLLGDESQPVAQPEAEQSEYRDASGAEIHGDQAINEEIDDADPEGTGFAARMKHGDAVVDDRIAKRGEQVPEKMKFSPEELSTLSREERLKRTIETEDREREALTKGNKGQEQQATIELTAEQFQPIVEQTHQLVKDLNLVEAPKLAADLAPYFATPIAEHAEKIGLMVGGLTLGASQLLTQLYQDGALDPGKPMEFEKLAPLPEVACNYLAEQWCAFRGQKGPAHDPVTLGNAMRNGIANLIHSRGKTDPQMAVLWVQAVEKASTGRDIQVSEKEALAFVNALTPHIRGAVGKFNAVSAQAKPAPKGIPRMTSAKKYDGIRTPGLRKQVKQAGNGLDAATLAVYQREHGRL